MTVPHIDQVPDSEIPEAEEKIKFENHREIQQPRTKRPSIHVSPPESKRSQRLSVTLVQPPSDLIEPVIEKTKSVDNPLLSLASPALLKPKSELPKRPISARNQGSVIIKPSEFNKS